MSNIDNAFDKVGTDAQALHQRLAAANAKDRVAAQDQVRGAAAEAQRLAASIKTIAQSQENDVKRHLNKAASSLEDAERQADIRATADDAQLKQAKLVRS